MSNKARTRIVILGGGFGGIYAALGFEKALAHGADLDVTLVNRENFFLFTPMLHEVAASDLDMTDIVKRDGTTMGRGRDEHRQSARRVAGWDHASTRG